MAATQRYVKPAFTLSTAAEGSWSLVAAVASSGGGCTFFAVVLSITNKVWYNEKKERRRRREKQRRRVCTFSASISVQPTTAETNKASLSLSDCLFLCPKKPA
jgi:hypothetical protein